MERRGFTLIEIMISSTLVGLVGLAFGTLYASVHANWVMTLNAVAAQNEITYCMEHVRQHINQATTIEAIPATLPRDHPLAEDNFGGVGFTIDPDGAGSQLPVKQYYMNGFERVPSTPTRPNGKIDGIRYYQSISDTTPKLICKDIVDPNFNGDPGTVGTPTVPGAIRGSGSGVVLSITVHRGKSRTAVRRSISTNIAARGTP